MDYESGTRDMEILGDLIGGGLSVASGGIFGLFGSVFNKVVNYFQAKQAFEQEKERREWDREDFKLQMEFSAQETEQEIAIASAEGAWSGLEASIRADAMTPATGFAASVKTLFRPFLTTLLVCVSAWIVYLLWSGITTAQSAILVVMTEAEIKDLLRYSIYSLIFATTTAVVWWWGDRAPMPPGLRFR